jgi:hypothetical protein
MTGGYEPHEIEKQNQDRISIAHGNSYANIMPMPVEDEE